MGELPFDDPEVEEAIETTLNALVAESDRGAVLVAAELINNTLGQFLPLGWQRYLFSYLSQGNIVED